jgi:hypothetical protein
MLPRKRLAGCDTPDLLGHAGLGIDLSKRSVPSLDPVVEAEIRNKLTPRQPSAYAPPALTFGRPGKQRVKPIGQGRFLIRPVRYLLRNINNFTHCRTEGVQGSRPGSEGTGGTRLLCPQAPFCQHNLILQEIGKGDALNLQRLGIKRGLGQARQGVGFEIDRPVGGDDEIRPRIAAA